MRPHLFVDLQVVNQKCGEEMVLLQKIWYLQELMYLEDLLHQILVELLWIVIQEDHLLPTEIIVDLLPQWMNGFVKVALRLIHVIAHQLKECLLIQEDHNPLDLLLE